jgi:hypothetical protein
VDQQVIEQSSSLEQTVERILSDLGWDRVTSEQFSARPVSDLK